MPAPAVLFASILFGIIGTVALMYGKRMEQWKTMIVGGTLLVFPYFVSQTWAIYAIGCALCVALFVFRD